jgi:hypothetical protein
MRKGPPSFSTDGFWNIIVNPSPAVGSFASQAPDLGNVPPLAGCAHKAHNLHKQCKFDYT